MHHEFLDIFDSHVLNQACEAFTVYSGMGTAVLDMSGIIHASAGWQDICTNFHRVNACTASRCRESDTVLANRLSEGQEFNLYRCKNGLVDAAIPIWIEEEHVGNFYTGQFLLQDPDIIFFERQAETYQFDKDSYLNALKKVPVYDEAAVQKALEYLVQLTQLLGTIGLEKHRALEAERLKELELQTSLKQQTEELKRAKAQLKALSAKLRERSAQGA